MPPRIVTTRPSGIADLFGFFAKLRAEFKNCAILESLDRSDESTGRYSFLGAIAQEELVCREGVAHILSANGHRPVADWRQVLDAWCPVGAASAPSPFQTGTIGYIGYDAKYAFENFQRTIPADTSIPDVHFVRYAAVLVRDHLLERSVWAYEQGQQRTVDELERRWSDEWKDAAPSHPGFAIIGDVTPDFAVAAHLEKVARAIEYVRAGDIFQANITGRFSAKYVGDLIACYASLRKLTPNPFFALLDFEQSLLSTSPERFFKVVSDRIISSPIKGTARCIVDGKDQYEAFGRSAKDRAENTMIVDLVRNDLGRICRQGTVKLEGLCEIKRFNQLYHMVSTVSGELIADVSASRIIAAQFPGGSVTGAPKIRAVDIIEELEPVRRGPYCGAIGFFGSSGWIDTCIAIRVLYTDRGRLFLHAGGGIVVDSDPAAECAELFLKVESILDVLSGCGARRRSALS
jgi:para-aminobenzoate synthetase component I